MHGRVWADGDGFAQLMGNIGPIAFRLIVQMFQQAVQIGAPQQGCGRIGGGVFLGVALGAGHGRQRFGPPKV